MHTGSWTVYKHLHTHTLITTASILFLSSLEQFWHHTPVAVSIQPQSHSTGGYRILHLFMAIYMYSTNNSSVLCVCMVFYSLLHVRVHDSSKRPKLICLYFSHNLCFSVPLGNVQLQWLNQNIVTCEINHARVVVWEWLHLVLFQQAIVDKQN